MEASISVCTSTNNEKKKKHIDHKRKKDVSHIGIRSRRIWRTDAGINKPIVAMLESRNFHIEDLLNMVRKIDFFNFDARILYKSLANE